MFSSRRFYNKLWSWLTAKEVIISNLGIKRIPTEHSWWKAQRTVLVIIKRLSWKFTHRTQVGIFFIWVYYRKFKVALRRQNKKTFSKFLKSTKNRVNSMTHHLVISYQLLKSTEETLCHRTSSKMRHSWGRSPRALCKDAYTFFKQNTLSHSCSPLISPSYTCFQFILKTFL